MKALGPALAVLVLTAPSGAASHFQNYATNPVEHDDQGRSDEPDFERTGVLGPWVENRVVDLDQDGWATRDRALPPPLPGHAPVVAPGCTQRGARQPSGACGICTVGGRVEATQTTLLPAGTLCLAEDGGAPPPGAFFPTRERALRLLDVRIDTMLIGPIGGAQRLDVNHKVADAAALRAREPFLAGPVSLWAWLGDWADRNGNGVIDHLGGASGGVDPRNEFTWRGQCLMFNGLPGTTPACAWDGPGATLAGYAFPGNHHSYSGVCAGLCWSPLPWEYPGRQVVNWLMGFYPDHVDQLDPYDEAYAGDPLLGPQGSVAPDQWFTDRTGEDAVSARGWEYGVGQPTWYYDQSLLVSHVLVAAYRAPAAPLHPNLLDLGAARFLDVDRHRSLDPAVEDLVQGLLKPKVRALWVFVRDETLPV